MVRFTSFYSIFVHVIILRMTWGLIPATTLNAIGEVKYNTNTTILFNKYKHNFPSQHVLFHHSGHLASTNVSKIINIEANSGSQKYYKESDCTPP